MAADINTQLQNITTDVTAISNLVNRLVTIFSSGGVQNPDLATLKAELQGWTNTQLSNYVNLNATQDILGTKNFKGETYISRIYIKNFDLDINNFVQGNYIDGVIYFRDKEDNNIGVFTGSCALEENAYRSFFSFNLYGKRQDSRLIALQLCRDTKEDGTFNFYGFLQNINVDYAKTKSNYKYNPVNINWFYNSPEGVAADKANVFKETNIFYDVDVYFQHKNRNYQSIVFSPNGKGDEKTAFIYHKNNDSGAEPVSILSFYAVGRLKDDTSQSKQAGIRLEKSYNNVDRFVSEFRENYFNDILPSNTNTHNLGTANSLWKEIFSGNGVINTSDERKKTEIKDIPESVFRAWSKIKFQQFKFKDAVEKKGVNARVHMGVIAQRIKEAFESEGLEAERYGLFCHDTWEDEYEFEDYIVEPEVLGQVKVVDKKEFRQLIEDKDGNLIDTVVEPEEFHYEEGIVKEAVIGHKRVLKKEKGDLYSVRYEECLALECAYQRWRLEKIEEKLGL